MPTTIPNGDNQNKQDNPELSNKNESGTSAPINAPAANSMRARKDEEDNAPYYDRRYIIISLVENYSYYRKANDKVLDDRNEYIGSCIRSSKTLAANKGEVETYFPNLIGVSTNNEHFVRRVKDYLNNIHERVDKLGKKLNIGFHYNHLKDYLAFKEKEERIDREYYSSNRGDSIALREALANKIDKLNALESEKYMYGYPDNLADYLLYRHCLLYKDVAKDTAIINSDNSVRFYFRDEQKEAELQRKRRFEINEAKRNYVTLLANDKLFDDVYIQYCVASNKPIVASLNEDKVIKENNLDYFSDKEAAKFNKMIKDADISIKAMIEKLIAYGIFTRHPHSQNILSADGDYIGANMKEAVVWFKSPDNKEVVAAYENKLKRI